MLWPLFVLVGALAGLGVVGGVIKGTVDTVKHNRSNKINNTTTKETKAKKRKAKKEKTETVEEKQEKVRNENNDVKKWTEKNDVSDEKIKTLVEERVNKICEVYKFKTSEVEAQCKNGLANILIGNWKKIMKAAEEQNVIPNIDTVSKYILEDPRSYNVLKEPFAKYIKYDTFVAEVNKLEQQLSKARQEGQTVEYKKLELAVELAREHKKNLEDLLKTNVKADVYSTQVNEKLQEIERKKKEVEAEEKQNKHIGELYKKTKENSKKITGLDEQLEIAKNNLKELEKKLSSKANTGTVAGITKRLNNLVKNIDKLAKDDHSHEEMVDMLNDIKSLRKSIETHVENESIHSTLNVDLVELEKTVTKEIVKTVTKEVVKKSTTKVEKLQDTAKKKLVEEVIAKVREALKEDISEAINIDDLTKSVIDNIEVTNKR